MTPTAACHPHRAARKQVARLIPPRGSSNRCGRSGSLGSRSSAPRGVAPRVPCAPPISPLKERHRVIARPGALVKARDAVGDLGVGQPLVKVARAHPAEGRGASTDRPGSMRQAEPGKGALTHCARGAPDIGSPPMRIRIVEGPGAPAEHIAVVDQFGVVIDGRGYCPLDDLRGIVIVDVSDDELVRLSTHSFEFPLTQ